MIEPTFFADNRTRLASQSEGVIAVVAYDAMQLTGDMAAPFRQESHFWYLTGIKEPGWQLIMTPKQSWLVSPDVSEVHRIFDGGLSDDDAKAISGVDEVLSTTAAREVLLQLAQRYPTAYGLDLHPHQKYFDFTINPAPARLWRQLKKEFQEVRDIRQELNRLRAIKRPVEVAAITKAIEVTVDTFAAVRSQLPTLTSENQVEAEFTYAFRRQDVNHAYDPIVASGRNACTLHYIANNGALKQTDLLLLDIGARVDGYAADITRTYSVGDTPSRRHVAVHGAVRQAHEQIIDLLCPGLTFAEYQDKVDEIMKQALQSLDLLKNDGDYRRYFPHAISHGLGVDVHDSLGGFEAFQSGMVLTVEPGIYIPEESIGVRLEDDILITDKGYHNLSEALSLDL